MSNFEKLQFLNDKIDQNTNFGKLTSAKWLLVFLKNVIKCYHPRNKVLQNCSAVFGSVSLVREKLKELRDFFFTKSESQTP